MESAMLNLLSNGFKYKAADRRPQIHFEAVDAADSIGFKVTDNGQGIDLEKYGDQLFGFNLKDILKSFNS
ncbi:MAG: ATP-binding protein [Cyclobacteriaceae bacterium]